MALYSEPNSVTTELKPCESNDDASDNALDLDTRFKAYEPLPDMTNIDLSGEGGLEFSQLSYRTSGHASIDTVMYKYWKLV
ncbi:hypothetical protein J1N35_044284 [Gossypium stocksii]|uniref:Uncharacterized protein n=1 Tax=Gossypium stocksii TaxID=47602 RepID=A0A9D3U975_9ROSI|nr:hypothetical protein J1N35_044284 [Gossypium stocksii]